MALAPRSLSLARSEDGTRSVCTCLGSNVPHALPQLRALSVRLNLNAKSSPTTYQHTSLYSNRTEARGLCPTPLYPLSLTSKLRNRKWKDIHHCEGNTFMVAHFHTRSTILFGIWSRNTANVEIRNGDSDVKTRCHCSLAKAPWGCETESLRCVKALYIALVCDWSASLRCRCALGSVAFLPC